MERFGRSLGKALEEQMQVDHREPLTSATHAILSNQPNDGGLCFLVIQGKSYLTRRLRIHKRYWTSRSRRTACARPLRPSSTTMINWMSRAHVEVILTHGRALWRRHTSVAMDITDGKK